MPDEDKVERRSMVGAPPTSSKRSHKTPVNVRPTRTIKRTKKEESEDENESGSDKQESDGGDFEESGEDGEAGEVATPTASTKRKKRRVYLTDYNLKKKKIMARRASISLFSNKSLLQKSATPEDEEEPEHVAKSPTLLKYSPMQLMCDHLLRKIMSKDPEEYFAFPVTPSMAPDYHNVIAHPMDFSTMRQKIEDGKYQTLMEMRADCELIVANAMTYNSPNTVYHLASSRLASISKYYFSEQYIRYIFHTLPFANKVPLEKAGLVPLSTALPRSENGRRTAIVDDLNADDCLKAADDGVRRRLTKRIPKAKIAFIDNKDGATVLNVLSDESSTDGKQLKLGDIVGHLEEGTPGMIALSEHRLFNQAPINYLNYGPFCSFAPQYDSTWSTLTKRDSELLMRTYGDRSTLSDVVALREMVSDAGEHFIKVVDDLLDSLTDGEHSRTMVSVGEKKPKFVDVKDSTDICTLLEEVKTLENLGLDVGFTNDIYRQLNRPAESADIQTKLNVTGQAIVDLESMQRQRLSQPPPLTLTKVAGSGPTEVKLAEQVQQQLVQQIATHMTPADVASVPALHQAISIQDDFDMDLLDEFFVTQN